MGQGRCRGPPARPGADPTLAPQEVGLWLLFVPPRSRRCREVVVRTRSEDSWSDLETHLEEETPKVRALQAPGAVVLRGPWAPAWGSVLTLTAL